MKRRLTFDLPESESHSYRMMNKDTGEILECSHLAPLLQRVAEAMHHSNLVTVERVGVPENGLDPVLTAALGRLQWVVPGRNYGPQLIADVREVLRHFDMTPASGDGA